MVRLMGIVNLTPDSFFESSRTPVSDVVPRVRRMIESGVSIVDLGAVSTRPGAAEVGLEEEWSRLEPALSALSTMRDRPELSIDTERSEIIRRAVGIVGPVIVNDISAGESDSGMLPLAGRLGLRFIAMHKRGGPQTMDGLCDYPSGVIPALLDYFREFGRRASEAGVQDWILDPGLGFAKTPGQCWEILYRLEELSVLGRPLLIGAADKRFTEGNTALAHAVAIMHGADILRIHCR